MFVHAQALAIQAFSMMILQPDELAGTAILRSSKIEQLLR
jgi:hypothetical protein